MNVILLGPPGAGKGTQAEILCKNGFIHIATGDLLREALAQKTPLGLQAKAYIEKGALVPNELVEALVFAKIEQAKSSHLLLDGYPRNASQCESIDTFLELQKIAISHVISFEVPEDELVTRMMGRGRKDDTEAVIKNRFEVFKNETTPVIEHYASKNLVHEIDGIGSVEDISNRISEVLRLNTIPQVETP